jgi:4-amino-4-deoxy-L-arabinose transferase-like glycosyltransferase
MANEHMIWGSFDKRRLWTTLALIAILVAYTFAVLQLHPRNFFGLSEDDAIYFSSAKALAEGKGYILPSVPGTPPATKYPILYPWLLSLVWRWNPHFPANLMTAIRLNLVFGCAFVLAIFFFLRSLPGLGVRVSLLLTGICALNPASLLRSAMIMSDIPFTFFALMACVLAARATNKTSGWGSTVFVGLLSGLAIMTRILGVPIAVGLCIGIALRGTMRKAALFVACVLPFAAAIAWQSSVSRLSAVPSLSLSSCPESWSITWFWYTAYPGYWKANIISNHVFWQTLRGNFLVTLIQPGSYFVHDTTLKSYVFSMGLIILVSAVAIRGMVRHAHTFGLQPAHLALAFYLVPVLLADLAEPARYTLPLLPLIAAGIAVEVRRLSGMVRQSFQESGHYPNRAAGILLFSTAALCIAAFALAWRNDIQSIGRWGEAHQALSSEKEQAYAWLRQNTQPSTRIIAYEDVNLYLYTDRQGLRPTIFSVAGLHRPEVMKRELSCLLSSADPIGARYWVASDDDYELGLRSVGSGAKLKSKDLETEFPLVFGSRKGHVRIRALVQPKSCR